MNINDEYGSFCTYRTFEIDTTPPIPPELLSPADNSNIRGWTKVTWAASLTGNGYQVGFSVLETPPIELSGFDYYSAANFIFEATPHNLKYLTLYYWFVRARDSLGNWSDWSTPRRITFLPTIPNAPTLVDPAPNLLTKSSAPLLDWYSVGNGSAYNVQISSDINFTTLLQDIEVPNMQSDTYCHPNPLSDGSYYWRVRAKNILDEYGPFSPTWMFTVDTTGPLPPTQLLPVDNTMTRVIPTFSWDPSSDAVRYQFGYGTSTIPPLDGSSSRELNVRYFTPTNMSTMTLYYWFVRAKDSLGNWGDWSSPNRITILPWIPIAPSQTYPSANSLTTDTTPELLWSPVTYGASYNLQISSNSGYSAIILDIEGILEQSNLVKYTTNTLADGTYYWRVRAMNANNEYGPYSSSITFAVDATAPLPPNLLLPADGTSSRGTPIFSWETSKTATKYQFAYGTTISTPSDISGFVHSSGELTSTIYTPPTIQIMTQYYWFVRARDTAGNWSNWSTPYQVTVLPVIPVAPSLISPAANYLTTDTTPDFSWNSVPDGSTYNLQISADATFTTITQNMEGISVLTSSCDSLPDGTYSWRVRATNTLDEYGPYSPSKTFTIDTTGPLPPGLSSPLDNSSLRGTPTFSWRSSLTAAKYQFAYGLSATPSADLSGFVYASDELTTTFFIPPAIPLMTQYYWFVRARDSIGNWGNWSTPNRITILPLIPVVPVLVSPATNYLTTDTTPDFSWNSVTYGSTYNLQLSTNSTFTMIIRNVDGISDLTNTADPLPDGTYYWRVRAMNVNNEYGTFSINRIISIDSTSPLPPILSQPFDSATPRGIPTFSWKASTSATRYLFGYGTTNDPTSNPGLVLFETSELSTLSYKPASMPYMTELYWFVKARDLAGNWSDWSAARKISIIPLVPIAPTLNSPITNYLTNNSMPELTWKSVTYGVTHHIQISSNTKFTSLVQDVEDIGGLSYSASVLADGKYYWRVQAMNANGEYGPFSAYRTIAIDTIAPLQPLLNQPANGKTLTGTPTFSWKATSTASQYKFAYGTSDTPPIDESEFVYVSTQLSKTYYIPPTIAPNTLFYWFVKARDAAGNWSNWSIPNTITINPTIPVAPILVAPSTVYISATLSTFDLGWKSVAYGYTYDIQIDNISNFSSPNYTYTSYIEALSISINIPETGKWYWRVRARNINGVAGAWSASRYVTIYPEFNNDFNNSGNLEGWVSRNDSSWTVNNGTLNTNGQIDGYASQASYGTTSFSNFNFETRMRMGAYGLGGFYGLVIRGSLQDSIYWKTYYLAGITQEKYNGSYYGCVYLLKSVNFKLSMVKYNCQVPINIGSYNNLKVYVKGTTLKYYVNDSLAISSSITGASSGLIGFNSWAWVDDNGSAIPLGTTVDWVRAGLPQLPTSTASISANENIVPKTDIQELLSQMP
jgi:hypothetical protein